MPAVRKRLPLAARYAPDFDRALVGHGLALRRAQTTTLQINVGKLCNQACHHCHVEAGPKRTEIMPREVAARVIELLAANPSVTTLDITGGAPELNPSFRWLVDEARGIGRHVIDRCNLTVLFEPGVAAVRTGGDRDRCARERAADIGARSGGLSDERDRVHAHRVSAENRRGRRRAHRLRARADVPPPRQ